MIDWTTLSIPDWITAINALLVGIIGVSLLIPGEQPEKFLRILVDILSKFSKK